MFDEEGALDRFEGFASRTVRAFYGLPLNEGRITLRRKSISVPASVDANGTPVVPFHAGEEIGWEYMG
jgi:dihydroorotase